MNVVSVNNLERKSVESKLVEYSPQIYIYAFERFFALIAVELDYFPPEHFHRYCALFNLLI